MKLLAISLRYNREGDTTLILRDFYLFEQIFLSMYQWFSNDLKRVLDVAINNLWYESATV